MAATAWVVTAIGTAALLAACAKRPAYELEYEKPVTNVWVGEQAAPPPAATTTPGAGVAPAAARVPVAQPAPSTTLPRPSAWVRPDPVKRPQ